MKNPVDCDSVISKRTVMISNASKEDKLFPFAFLDTNEGLFFTLLSMTWTGRCTLLQDKLVKNNGKTSQPALRLKKKSKMRMR